MPRIVHLTTVHSPDDSRIFHKECRTLAKAGYEVFLVAPESEGPPGLGVQFRVLPPVRNRIARITLSSIRAFRAGLALDGEVYHFHDPELLPVGVALRVLGRRVIYDAHEDLPQQILAKPWIASPLRRPLAVVVGRLQWAFSRILSGTVAATPTIADRFPGPRTVCVQNFPMTEEFSAVTPLPYDERPLRVAYVGRVDRVRGAREMLLAMDYLRDATTARLCIAGKVFGEDLEAELDQLPAADRVDYLGWLGRDEIASLLATVRVGLVVLHPKPAYLNSYPIKLFEYMAAGVPVVASDFPLWRSIIEDAGCGIVVDPLDPREIATAIREILDDPKRAAAMGERGRRAVLEKYSWQPQASKLLALYAELCGISAAPEATLRAAVAAIPSSNK